MIGMTKSAEDAISRIIRGERKRYDLEDIKVTKNQQKMLNDFHIFLINVGRPINTRINYLQTVVSFIPHLRGRKFENLTSSELRTAYTDFMLSKKDLKPATKENNYAILQVFFKWLEELEGVDGKYTAILKKNRYKRPKGERYIIKPDIIPTEEEILKIIKFAINPRDKAAIAMMYDLGTRPNELLKLNVGDVKFDKFGATVTIGEHGKTGGRTLRLISSLAYLREWVECHPYREDQNSPLFLSMSRRTVGAVRLDPPGLRGAFKQAAARAGIKRKLWTYLLRHASVTREASSGFGDQELKIFYGWSPDSRMLGIYSHLTSEDVNAKRLEKAGIIKPEKKESLTFKKCPRCGERNPVTADFCHKCASVLDERKYRQQVAESEKIKELEYEMDFLKEGFDEILRHQEWERENPEKVKNEEEIIKKYEERYGKSLTPKQRKKRDGEIMVALFKR
jgi:integrase/ribosomal protein L40E